MSRASSGGVLSAYRKVASTTTFATRKCHIDSAGRALEPDGCFRVGHGEINLTWSAIRKRDRLSSGTLHGTCTWYAEIAQLPAGTIPAIPTAV